MIDKRTEFYYRSIIAISAAIDIIITVYFLSIGVNTVFQNIFYFTIVLAAYRYRWRGAYFSTVISAYYLLVFALFYPDLSNLVQAVARTIIFIVIGFVVAYLSNELHKEKRKEKARYQTIFSASGSGMIAVIDNDRTIVEFNSRFSEFFGVGANIGKKIDEFFEPKGINKAIECIVNGEEPHGIEMDMASRMGEKGTCLVTIGRLNPDEFVLSISDITERKHAEEALRSNEEKLNLILNNMSDAVWLLDMQQKFIWMSPSIFRNSGFTLEELNNIPIERQMEPRSFQKMTMAMATLLTPENLNDPKKLITFVDELEFYRKDGNTQWIDTISKVLRDELGRPTSILMVGRDITERKKAEEALRRSKEDFRVISENSPDHIIVQDNDLRYIWVLNPQMELTQSDMIGKTDYDILSKEDADKLTSVKREVLKSSKEMKFITSLSSPDGGLEYFDGVFKPRFDSKGQIDGIFGYFRNVTEITSARNALAEANHKLNLLSSVTRHDIRNQLMALDGNLTLLSMKELDPASKELLRKSNSALNRISAMIQFTKEYENIGVKSPIWQNVRSVIEKEAKGVMLGDIKLVNDVPADIEVYADPLITKVLHNLINNSIGHGGKVTVMHFSAEEVDGARRIVCEDDGIGILPEMKKELFTHSPGKTHGFGLFLSREILAITGISILENGKPGRGVRFEITVPESAWRSRRTNNIG